MNAEVDFLQIKQFIERQFRRPMNDLSYGTELGRDLGLDGADAEEFIRAFSKCFGVDLRGFVFELYFGPEAGFNLFWYLWKSVRGKPSQRQLKPLTIRDLIRVADRKSWNASDIGIIENPSVRRFANTVPGSRQIPGNGSSSGKR